MAVFLATCAYVVQKRASHFVPQKFKDVAWAGLVKSGEVSWDALRCGLARHPLSGHA